MLLSMTGLGECRCQQDGTAVSVEVRTVNNRYFKIVCRAADGYGSLEPLIETVVRRHVRRGSVHVKVCIDREATPDDFRLNEIVLRSYRRQIEALCGEAGPGDAIRLESLLALPGVVDDSARQHADVERIWPLVERTLGEALTSLTEMRVREGAVMAADLLENCRTIAADLQAIEARSPAVVEAYRRRLTERLNRLLEEHEVCVDPADIVREVGVFADRNDISEEIVRLRSHLDQFESLVESEESNGRKLDFLVQEMLREANTIGAKANDAAIARRVVEIKAAIERMREMIQNVE